MKNQESKSKKYEKVTISFTEADTDLIEYLNSLKKANKTSEFVRKAIREKIERNSKEKDVATINKNVLKKIESLEKRIELIENVVLGSDNKVVEELKEEQQENDKINIDKANENEEEKKSDKESDVDESISNALNYFDF